MTSYLSSWWSGKSSEVATTDASAAEQVEETSSNTPQDTSQVTPEGPSISVKSDTTESSNTKVDLKPTLSGGAGPSRPKDTFKVPALPTRSLAPNQSVASSSSLVPPPIPSRQGPAPTLARPRIQEPKDIDAAPQFPLPDSAQRSRPAPPSFDIDIRPPSPDQEDEDEPPSDLNIAILPGTVPLGNMAPPPSTTAKPAFGMQNGAPISKAKRREKVALGPGYSPLDWARLTQSGRNLRGVEGPKRVTLDELAKHNDQYDAWMALDGIVYNITPYVRFHPGGGKELLRGAGRDGTKLFMNTHSWVNYTHMLQECIVGRLVRK